MLPLALLLLTALPAIAAVSAARPVPGIDCIYQFLLPCNEPDRPNLGAYLWIPPNTPRIRAVMTGMHNGLPVNVTKASGWFRRP